MQPACHPPGRQETLEAVNLSAEAQRQARFAQTVLLLAAATYNIMPTLRKIVIVFVRISSLPLLEFVVQIKY